MLNRKKRTPKSIAANRKNALKSTGPRTDRGKRISGMNALKLGIFSKEVAIPQLDGEDALERYEQLLNGFQKEHHPHGPMQTWLVEFMTQRVWRLGRVLRAERGACLLTPWVASAWSGDEGPMQTLIEFRKSVERSVERLDAASAEIQRTGTLNRTDVTSLSELIGVELPGSDNPQQSEPAQVGRLAIDENFVQRLEAKQVNLRSQLSTLDRKLAEGMENHVARWAVPSQQDVERLLRYEVSMLKQIDWAWRLLSECQKRPKKS